MKTTSLKFILPIVCLLLLKELGAQCLTCGTLVNSNATTSYTVSTGQSLCVAPGFTYTGTLYLNGGTICNDGTITNLVFKSGRFNNYGKLVSGGDLVIDNDGRLVINNYTGARFLADQNLNINSGSSDSLYINIFDGSSLNVTDNFSLTATKAMITLGLAPTTTTDNAFITTINVNGNLVLNPAVQILGNESGFLNVAGNATMKGASSQGITNLGEVNVSGNLLIPDDVASTATVLIDNSGEFSVNGSFTCTANDGKVVINNHSTSRSRIYVDRYCFFSTTAFTLTNNAALEVNDGLYLYDGKMINNYRTVCSSLTVESGTLTNNDDLSVLYDLKITDSDGRFTNGGVVMVGNDLVNKGTLNLSKRSVCKTENFDNQDAGAYVYGPSDILNESSEADSSNYARLIVNASSHVAGSLDGYLFFTDMTYTGSATQTIDETDDARVGDWVLFGDVGRTRCTMFMTMGRLTYVGSNTPRSTFCPGETLMFQFTSYYPPATTPTWTYTGTYGSMASSSGGTVYIFTNVQSSGLVTVNQSFVYGESECSVNTTYSVTIAGGAIVAASPLPFSIGSTVALTSTVTAGTGPCSYTWSPNNFFVSGSNNTVQNPVVAPQVALIYTVSFTDVYGCTGTNTVELVAQPYALLDKALNGEYYNLFANKLLFKYDGQYANTTFTFNVYDYGHALANSGVSINTSAVVPGDNRYVLNAAGLGTGYYVLEVVNEKSEKLYLRFKK